MCLFSDKNWLFSNLQIIRKPDDSMLAFLLGTAIGVMFVLSVAEMWIHNAMEHGWPGVTAATLCGALLYQLISPFLPDFESAAELSTTGAENKGVHAPYVGHGHEKEKDPLNDVAIGKSSAVVESVNGASPRAKFNGLAPRWGDAVASAADSPVKTNDKKEEIVEAEHDRDDKGLTLKQSAQRSKDLLRLGFLMAVTMTLHNAPEGFAGKFYLMLCLRRRQ